jgi:hypothetical protein
VKQGKKQRKSSIRYNVKPTRHSKTMLKIIDKMMDDWTPRYMEYLQYSRIENHLIYFVESPESNCVKIGLSQYHTLPLRLSQLQTGNPNRLHFIGTIPGDAVLESMIHDVFRKHRMRAEWFRLEGDLAKFIQTVFRTKRGNP